jgi:amino acid adenylation domain-containing protein
LKISREAAIANSTECVTSGFARQAAQTPSAIAVASSVETLSYAELDSRSNRLAHHLCSLGVGCDIPVGIFLERTPAMVVAALAVLKAGGAYIPLDPAQPTARLAFMLQDAKAGLVISDSRLAGRLPAGSWQVVELDRDAAQIAAQPETLPEQTVRAEDLAYIIYTSGSTGEPKGVEIPHRGLANLIAWHQREFAITSSDRASHLASLVFDAAVWELWPYLSVGATVYLVDDRVRSDAKALRDWIVAKQITISFAPTALAENLFQLDWPKATALRYLLTGADVLKKYPAPGLPFTLVNNYGPTESTVVTTSGKIAASHDATQTPSIGRPIDGVQIYILDEQGQPVRDGAAGELYIGGASLARGYRNRPQLTAERFVANPFSTEPGARLYRTGDLARWLPNGEIAFLGRLDEQIKVRGYRVEPGEIATALAQHPALQNAFVTAVDDDRGQKELVAYVVANSENTLRALDLRDYLLQRLPEYMIPGEYVALDSLPITANGKVDRAALPSPTTHRLRDEAYVGPRTPVEEELAKILAPLLKIDRVGVNDNFFLLGGHSLLGTQLIARVSEAFGVDLTLLKLFDNPTVAAMSAEIENLILAKLSADHSSQPSPTPQLAAELSGARSRSAL